tara:strand:- start:398 stop:622 length:225 start_codon:yes stop_codon:yes gene_type:complete
MGQYKVDKDILQRIHDLARSSRWSIEKKEHRLREHGFDVLSEIDIVYALIDIESWIEYILSDHIEIKNKKNNKK